MRKIIFFLLLPVGLFAQDHAALLRQYMTGQNKYFQFNGNILVVEKGQPIYYQALGYADYNTKRMLNDSSVFELASLSKQFTAMGIMMLKERGKLSYDDNLKRYFPGFPYDNITIRNLLTHTSGLPEYEEQFDKNWDKMKIAHNSDIIEMLQKIHDTLYFKPGTKWKYSNTGYALLASIIEKVSGMTYNDFLMKNIFKPLGMTHTFVYNTRRSTHQFPDNYAIGYVYSDSLKKYVVPDDLKRLDMVYYLDGIVGDGCVNSTIGDLYKWDRALYTTKLVSKSALDEMFSPLVQTNPRDTSSFYGFGEFIRPHSEKGKVITHTGSWPGYATLIERYPDVDETIIILSNNESAINFFRVAVESIMNNESLIMPYEHKEVKIDPAVLDEYVGKYNAGLTMEFIKKDGKLYRHRNGNPDIELKPESDTKFFYADGTDRQIQFEKENGKVTKVWFINMGQQGELKKMQ